MRCKVLVESFLMHFVSGHLEFICVRTNTFNIDPSGNLDMTFDPLPVIRMSQVRTHYRATRYYSYTVKSVVKHGML